MLYWARLCVGCSVAEPRFFFNVAAAAVFWARQERAQNTAAAATF